MLAFISKNVIMSLFVGVFSGAYLLAKYQLSDFFFYRRFDKVVVNVIESMADKWNAGIILQVLCIGGLIALITKMGGMKAMAIWSAKEQKAKHQCRFILIYGTLHIF